MGRSIEYPISEGAVFKLERPFFVHNKRAKKKIKHRVYYWIQLDRRGTPFRKAHNERKLRVLIAYVPTGKEHSGKEFHKEKFIQWDSIVTALRLNGYELLPEVCLFSYKRLNYKKFYQSIGAW